MMSAKKAIYLTMLLVWMGFIFYLSSQISTMSSEMSGIFIEQIRPYAHGFADKELTTIVRKSAHIFLYFLLGLLTVNLLKEYIKPNSRLVVLSIIFCFIYAITDELHQRIVSGRSAEVRDVILDTIGASLGVAFYWYMLKRKTNRLIDD